MRWCTGRFCLVFGLHLVFFWGLHLEQEHGGSSKKNCRRGSALAQARKKRPPQLVWLGEAQRKQTHARAGGGRPASSTMRRPEAGSSIGGARRTRMRSSNQGPGSGRSTLTRMQRSTDA